MRAAGSRSDGPSPATGPCWSTACDGDSSDTTPMELTLLGAHVSTCLASGNRFGGLQLAVQALHGAVAPRFVTTVALVLALLGIVLLVS